MKTIGIIGGLSWVSSQEYYRIINTETARRLGGTNSARIAMYSVNFAELERMILHGKPHEIVDELVRIFSLLEKSGAGFVMLGSNTIHVFADQVQRRISVPLLHIADATGEAIVKSGMKKVGMLGTLFTMEKDFYKGRLRNNYGLDVIVPGQADREVVNKIIMNELMKDIFLEKSKEDMVRIIQSLYEQGAEGVILGCTEIPLLVKKEDCSIPLFNTLEIHAVKAVDLALENQS